MAKLTERQAAFCRHLVAGTVTGMSAKDAAIKAGYAPKYADRQAHQLLENPRVSARINELRTKAEERALVTVEDVLNGLKREAENEAEGSSHAARVSAWAHLGKHLGMFTDRQEHTGGVAIRIIRD